MPSALTNQISWLLGQESVSGLLQIHEGTWHFLRFLVLFLGLLLVL